MGGIAIDLVLDLQAPMLRDTSNPATSLQFHGGVGRNIAENLARLGSHVTLQSVCGRQSYLEISTRLTEAGVDCSIYQGPSTGRYVSVHHQGEMVVAYGDLGETEIWTPPPLTFIPFITVFDANLLHYPPIVGSTWFEPVSVVKAQRCLLFIHSLEFISPNEAELESLCMMLDIEISGLSLSRIVPHVIVTRGGAGVDVYSGGLHSTSIPALKVPRVINTSGAGDALVAGTVHALNKATPSHSELCQAVLTGLELASRTVGVQGPCFIPPI